MAQHIETRDERPLQHFWLKNFMAVDTTDSRLAPLDKACFYDLTNAQPVGFSNIHSVLDISPVLHDFGSSVVYADWNININGTEHILIGCRDGTLWDYNIPANTTAQIGSNIAAYDGSLDIVQWDFSTALIIASNGYWYWTGTGQIIPVSQYPGLDAATIAALPAGGSAIAVYNQMVWIASKRLLNYSAATQFWQFSSAAGGGWTGLIDPTLKSDVQALFAANGYLYLFGETSIDAISDVYYPVDPSNGQQLTTPSFTKLNLSAIIGTDQPETIMVYGRLVIFANRLGVWSLYGTNVQSISAFDPNNMYLSSISGTWQYLDFNRKWLTLGWSPGGSREIQTFQKTSAGQVQTNALLNAGFLVWRLGDPIFPDGPVILMWQQDAAGSKWWSLDYSLYGELSHIVMALVNYQPALFGYIDNKLHQLVADPTSAPPARIMTALWDMEDPLTDKQAIRAGVRLTVQGSPTALGVNINMDTVRDSFPLSVSQIGLLNWANDTSQLTPWQNSSGTETTWLNVDPPFFAYWGAAPSCFSKYLGFTMTTRKGTIFEVNSFLLDYKLGPRWTGD
jgi:hypothetical protein